MKLKYIFFLTLFIGLTFSSCREDQDITVDETPIDLPKIKVEASVFGVVTNIDQLPVEDAVVVFDGKTTTTDAHGVFRFENESLYEDGTYISVEKDGYFKGSRRFYPKVGKESRVGIELMPMTIIDQVESTVASKVKFEDVELDFSANSVVTESGEAYVGTIHIAARYLDPTKVATLNQMPGDLTGFNTEEEVVSLTSLGMIGVELLDDDGNELQLKEGAPVAAIIPIPNELLDNAPSSIPLWHFDETAGIWVEEGEATKVGDHYEALLPHFSFWNCDYPGELIDLSGIILNRGLNVAGIQIRITTSTGAVAAGYTDEDGYYSGKVPANEELTLEVINACGEVVHSINIGGLAEDTVLDPINVNASVPMVNISGLVTSCDDVEISALTYVVVNVGNIETIINLDDDNTFSGVAMYCNVTDEIQVYAYDALNIVISGLSTFTIDGNIEVGELTLCEEAIVEQFIYRFGDEVVSINNTEDSLTIFTYEISSFEDKEVFIFSTLDWTSVQVAVSNFIYVPGVPIQDADMEILNEDFKASGQGSSQLVEQNEIEFYVFSGILDVIENVDGSTYTGDYTEVEYSIVIRK